MARKKETVLKLTSFRYKKEGISEKDFHDYASKNHAPKAAIVQARHGALRVAQVRFLRLLPLQGMCFSDHGQIALVSHSKRQQAAHRRENPLGYSTGLGN